MLRQLYKIAGLTQKANARKPCRLVLCFYPNLVSLYLPKFKDRLVHVMLVYLLTMLSRSLQPISVCAFSQTKCQHDRPYRTPELHIT